jgi:Secretion system C-terminal sorting domain
LVGGISTDLLEHTVNGFHVYPMPATDVLRIEGSPGMTGSVELLDMQGRVVLVQPVSTVMQLDVHALPRGSYVLRMGQGSARVRVLLV